MTIEGFSNRRDLVSRLEAVTKKSDSNDLVKVILDDQKNPLEVYPASVRKFPRGGVFLAGKFHSRDALFLLGKESLHVMQEYDGDIISRQSDFVIRKCRWTRSLAQKVREDFPFCAPTGIQEGQISLSFGDVLGLAGKAQLRAFKGKADLAFPRQCVHQLQKLDIQPGEALDAVTWTIFHEGHEGGFAAEACTITTPEEMQMMLDAGYTRFSLEAGEPELFSIREKPKNELLESMFEVPWVPLKDKFELMFHRYKGNRIDLGPVQLTAETEIPESTVIIPNEAEVLAAIRMFGDVIVRVAQMERILVAEGRRDDVILEISFAHSDGSLSPFELFFLVTELLRHDVQPDYVAPGEITREHWLVAGNTRLKGLTGPVEKLAEIPGERSGLKFHGVVDDISYETALECAVENDPGVFREIWETSRNVFEQVRKDADDELRIQQIPSSRELGDEELSGLLDMKNAKEFLGITMNEVLLKTDDDGIRYVWTSLFDFLRKHQASCTASLIEKYESDSCQEVLTKRSAATTAGAE